MHSIIHKLRVNSPNNIYIKREDLLPFSFGGNKVRIALEFFRDMIAQGKDCIIGYGSARSNLVRAIANMSCAFLQDSGRAFIVSPSYADGNRHDTFNTIIAELCGAKIIPCSRTNVAETVEGVMKMCEASGLKPYYINGDKYGRGNEAVPVRAYYKVYHEIADWQEETGINFQRIFLPVGTGMTIAGLIAGRHTLNGSEEITGISIARPEEIARRAVERYVSAFTGSSCDMEGISITDRYLCGGYGLYTPEVVHTVRDMLRVNGVAMDTTYTGKAFHGMCRYLEEHGTSGQNVLFIHTGGTPLFFDGLINA